MKDGVTGQRKWSNVTKEGSQRMGSQMKTGETGQNQRLHFEVCDDKVKGGSEEVKCGVKGRGHNAKGWVKGQSQCSKGEKYVVKGGFTNQMNMTQSSCDGVIGTKEQFPRNL